MITVGIPFFNAAATLSQAIGSVLGQSHQRFKLLLVDDGSVDGSLEIARAVRDSRVTVLSDGVNRGLVYRLNQIARLAQTPLVARMDADDVMHPLRLELQYDAFEANEFLDVLGTAAYSMTAAGKVIGLKGVGDFPTSRAEVLRFGRLFVHPTVMYRKEWLLANPYRDAYERAEDIELWVRTFDPRSFRRLSEPLLFYREASSSVEAYRRSCRTNRAILREYGPKLIGRARTVQKVCASSVKELAYRVAVGSDCLAPVLRFRSRRMPVGSLAESQAVLDRAANTDWWHSRG